MRHHGMKDVSARVTKKRTLQSSLLIMVLSEIAEYEHHTGDGNHLPGSAQISLADELRFTGTGLHTLQTGFRDQMQRVLLSPS